MFGLLHLRQGDTLYCKCAISIHEGIYMHSRATLPAFMSHVPRGKSYRHCNALKRNTKENSANYRKWKEWALWICMFWGRNMNESNWTWEFFNLMPCHFITFSEVSTFGNTRQWYKMIKKPIEDMMMSFVGFSSQQAMKTIPYFIGYLVFVGVTHVCPWTTVCHSWLHFILSLTAFTLA